MIAIAFPRYPRETIDIIRFCHARGINVSGITDKLESPLADLSKLLIIIPITFSTIFDSYASAFCLFNMIGVFASMKGVPEVQIYGSRERLPLLNAVYVNSYLATTLDFDDTYDGHPGSTVVPVALGIGELNNISGKALIESVVAGYEIGIRISNGIKPTPARTKKVRGINTWQIFCATAVAAKLFNLSRDQAAHAYGHAAIHASVPSLRKWGFSDGKIQWLKNNFGWTSYGGVLSALLSREGFIADTTIFDGEDGFWIMASSDQCNFDAIRESMDSFYTLKIHTKTYSACRHIHPTLDAVSAIVKENRPAAEQIDKVEVQTFYEVVNDYTFLPSLPFDVVFSTPYLIALVLHDIPPGADWFKEEHLRNEAIRKIARKVNIAEWDEASKLYPIVNRELMSKVQIKEKSGKAYNKTVRIPKGDPRNPMSAQEMFRKFDTLVTPVLGAEKSKQLYKKIMEELECLRNVKEITGLMAA